MNFQKACDAPAVPMVLAVLMAAVVVAAIAVRLWRQGIVLHAGLAMVLPPEHLETLVLEMLVSGLVQLLLLTGAFAYAHMRSEFTATPIRLRARAVPPRRLGYAASFAIRYG
jgi:hypothetical protein